MAQTTINGKVVRYANTIDGKVLRHTKFVGNGEKVIRYTNTINHDGMRYMLDEVSETNPLHVDDIFFCILVGGNDLTPVMLSFVSARCASCRYEEIRLPVRCGCFLHGDSVEVLVSTNEDGLDMPYHQIFWKAVAAGKL